MIRIFSHYIPIRTLALVSLETVVLVLSIYFGLAVSFLPFDHAIQGPGLSVTPKVMLLAFCIVTTMTAMGLYDTGVREDMGATVLRVLIAFAVGLAVASLAFMLVPELSVGPNALMTTFAVALFGSAVTRTLFVSWITPHAFQKRVLVLGTGSRAASVDELVKDKGGLIKIVGYLPIRSSQDHVDATRILSNQESLLECVKRHQATEIVIAVRDRRGGVLPVQELLECRLRGVEITDLASFFERERCQLHLESLNMSWMIFGAGFRQGFVRETVKRFFDVMTSAVLVLVTLPIMILTALCIYLEDRGPVFYRQERVGQGGRVFTIFKFRSMRDDAEKDGVPRWAARNDSRVTRIGRFIRLTRIDEIPQIINVLKGQMSFIGPRPERPFFVDRLKDLIPYYLERHRVKPGISGWAQLNYPYGASDEDAKEKFQYDLYYIKNYSLFLDLIVLVQTARVVLWPSGAGAR